MGGGKAQPPFIEWVGIQKQGCIQRVELRLTRLHALIGPNDSGKSTILRALAGVVAPGPTRVVATSGFDAGATNAVVSARYDTGLRVELQNSAPPHVHLTGVSAAMVSRGVRFVRFDPDDMRAVSDPLVGAQTLAFANERGLGLPSILGAVLERDRHLFTRIETEFCALFPHVHSILPLTDGSRSKILHYKLKTGVEITPQQASEGMLYALGFLVLDALDPAGLLLIEEPENGLHPARIREVMVVLRKLSARTQIVMATHSPLVVNELEADEISVITRPLDKGTQAVRLCDTPSYAERSKVYSNGDLWVSYADGVGEAALLDGGPRP